MDETLEVHEYPRQRSWWTKNLYNRLFWFGVVLVGLTIVALVVWAYVARGPQSTEGDAEVLAAAKCGLSHTNVSALAQHTERMAEFYRRHLNLGHVSFLASCNFTRDFANAISFGDVSTRPLANNADYQTVALLHENAQSLLTASLGCGLTHQAQSLAFDCLDLEFYLNLTALEFFIPQFSAAGFDGVNLPDRITAAAEILDTLLEDPVRGKCNGKATLEWCKPSPVAYENGIVTWLTRLAPAIEDWQRAMYRQVDLNKTHPGIIMEEQRYLWDTATARDYSLVCARITSNSSLTAMCLQAAALVNAKMLLFEAFYDDIYYWSAAAMRPYANDALASLTDGEAIETVLTRYHLRRYEIRVMAHK